MFFDGACPCLFSSSWYGWLQHTDWMSTAFQVANAIILGIEVTLDVKMNRRSVTVTSKGDSKSEFCCVKCSAAKLWVSPKHGHTKWSRFLDDTLN